MNKKYLFADNTFFKPDRFGNLEIHKYFMRVIF